MVSKVMSATLAGIEGSRIICECDLSNGLPGFEIVGLPGASVRESRDRVRAAIRNCGFEFPMKRITINLAPAELKKEGPIYDLPILIGILSCSGQIPQPPEHACFIGELSLTGKLRAASGILPMAMSAAEAGMKILFVPEDNAEEAAVAKGLEVYPVADLQGLVAHLKGERPLRAAPHRAFCAAPPEGLDFADVLGQENGKRALEIAAAGSHNILFIGPPGAGKSMLAKRLPSILPDMTESEALEATKIYSVAGLLGREMPMVSARPFRAPHHTVSTVGLTGGGSRLRPGEISLAHNGVLFLDELPEFRSDALEILRQPIEEGKVTITRIAGTCTYPSRFMLVCAMNPCKCGYYGDPSNRCTCTDQQVKSYLRRISGPLLDRIDLQIHVPAVDYQSLKDRQPAESSASIRARVNRARQIQVERYQGTAVGSNAYLTPDLMQRYCTPDTEGQRLLESAFHRFGFSARTYDRVLKVARTIADLAGQQQIGAGHIAEAIQYRKLDREDLV